MRNCSSDGRAGARDPLRRLVEIRWEKRVIWRDRITSHPASTSGLSIKSRWRLSMLNRSCYGAFCQTADSTHYRIDAEYSCSTSVKRHLLFWESRGQECQRYSDSGRADRLKTRTTQHSRRIRRAPHLGSASDGNPCSRVLSGRRRRQIRCGYRSPRLACLL